MTPMQIFKNQFDIFKKLLPSSFQELALNKSEDSTYISHWCGDRIEYFKKGVRSDFIKTFKLQFNDVNSYSIGFSFHYLNIPKEEQTIQISLKKGNKSPLFFKSEQLPLEKFKELFSSLLIQMQSLEDKNYQSIIHMIENHFHLSPSYPPKEKKHSLRKMKK
jgi:hypothetical protein